MRMRRVGGLDGVPLLVLAGQSGDEVADDESHILKNDGFHVEEFLRHDRPK